MKNYKSYEKTHIGSSDIGLIHVVGMGKDDIKCEFIPFGQDGWYNAYIVEADTEIPEHYHEVARFRAWATVYDDNSMVKQFYGDEIIFYRAGEMGMIVQVIGG